MALSMRTLREAAAEHAGQRLLDLLVGRARVRSRNALAVRMTPLRQKPHCAACSSMNAC